jgi:long-chain acyl-CoA synthetase
MFSLTSILITIILGYGLWSYLCSSKLKQSRKSLAGNSYIHSKRQSFVGACFQTIPEYLQQVLYSYKDQTAVGSRTALGKVEGNPKLAIKSDYQWKTFIQWYDEIQTLRGGLFSGSVHRGERVCIFADTQERWLTSALAVMKGGGIVTTAYATLGVDALIFSLRQTQSTTIITQSNLYESVIQKVLPQATFVRQVIFLDDKPAEMGETVEVRFNHVDVFTYDEILQKPQLSAMVEGSPVDLEDTALIMYTSGTTGNPKGIEFTHRQICHAIKSMTTTLPADSNITSKDRAFAYLPLAHILEMVMELSVLSQGGCIAYGDLRTMTDDSCVNREGQPAGDLSLAQPTLFAGVPKVYTRTYDAVKTQIAKQSYVKQKIFNLAFSIQHQLIKYFHSRSQFIDRFVFKPIQKKFGGQVRLFLSGGSALSSDVQTFISVVAGPIIQGYGLTETCCTGTLQHPHNCLDSNVGGPVMGNEITLRDCPELGYTLTDPLGASGEIWIGGPAIAKGYYMEPILTDEVFTLDSNHTKWFATGDIGRLMSDGTFKLIDRKKDLVKLAHGEYIALSNLESKYAQSSYLEHICLIGNSKLSNPVAIVVKKPNAPNELTILEELTTIAKANKLGPSEQIKTLVMVEGPWTIDNKCLTDTMKLKRNEIYKRYADEIKEYV